MDKSLNRLSDDAFKIYKGIYSFLERIPYTFTINLLEKAIKKANTDDLFRQRMEYYLLHGNTSDGRELFSAFGDYFEPNPNAFPAYRFADSVNFIDIAIYHLRRDDVEDAIAFINS